ncbi:MAG: helix-turn-helix transcriptional regulator [Clostridia bacterium]|nr:helix-turn-helix transcriptional regulator [Clostridia bacterium]
MKKEEHGIQCGVFDSNILRRNNAKSQNRVVGCFELELFHSDTGVSYVDEVCHPTRRGMLLCAKPGQIRHSEFPVRCSFIRITPGIDPRIDEILQGFPTCFYMEDDGEIEELLGSFAKLGSHVLGCSEEDWRRVRISAELYGILYRCMRLWQERRDVKGDAPANRLARDAYEYINEKYGGDCSLKTIAHDLHVSPNYLHTVFRQSVGMTPFELVTARRIDKAKKLIMAGEHTMLEIAQATGFCSQSHFNKVFKSVTGQTPIAYRRSLLEQY